MTDVPAAAPTRPPREVLERLFELHPQLFGARFLPLKLGIFQDIMERHPGAFGKDELKAALGFHTRSSRYLDAVASGAQRHDLDGQPAGEVATEHVHHAVMESFRRRQGRSKQDLRPWARERLAAVVRASGLDREAYFERVRADGDAAGLLDEVFAELGARQARHEALRRAFQASGRGVAEFAEMYGIDPKEAREALGEG